jgi:hypothetical protein
MAVVSNGTTIINAGALSAGFGGTLVLLSTQTASNSATVSFTTGLDSTYDAYEFHFIDIHPRTDSVNFTFNLSTDSGSNYNVTKTSTFFWAYHDEADTATSLALRGNYLGQSTAYQVIGDNMGNGADESSGGTLQLFNPSSTTYVKHWISTMIKNSYNDYAINDFSSGYGNTTSAVNAIQFKMSSGNFDGVIKLYGVKKS